MRYLAAVAFLAAIIAANYLTTTYGLIDVGPLGLMATAGTWAAGATFIFRDTIDDAWRRGVIALIIVGALLSWGLTDGKIALASGVAFLISELADLAVYRPLKRRGRNRAAAASNVVGSIVDTYAFLLLAGFPITWPVVLGQLFAKLSLTILYLAGRAVLRDPVKP